MLISSILLLSSNAVYQKRVKLILYAIIVVTILVCFILLLILSYYQFESFSSGSALKLESSFMSYGMNFASNWHLVCIYFAGLVSAAAILYFLRGNYKYFSLFVPSGCPLGLLALLVLTEFISYLV
jgi:TRAP-type C4-dicarboxylate transport system permease small subunit